MKHETSLHCPNSNLLGDVGRVDWEVYEKVDLTESEYKGICGGDHLYFCAFCSLLANISPYQINLSVPISWVMHGVPADAREDHVWLKRT